MDNNIESPYGGFPMNRKDAVVRFALLLAEVLTLCLLFQLSACGGSAAPPPPPPPPPVKHCTNCTVKPFLASANFALLETQPPYPAAYSTGAGANWDVTPWGQDPGVIWKPFSITHPSTTEDLYTSSTLATALDPMSVSFQFNPATGAWTSATLSQTATTSCGSSPQEFDFFLSPFFAHPQGFVPTLKEITAINFQGTVTLVSASQSTSSFECPVNQSGALASLILRSTRGQTLFYQVELSDECYPGTDPRQGCYNGGIGEGFCYPSNPYCAGGPITSFGHSLLNPGDSITMDGINIAPRLKALISGGSPDGMMDKDPADWTITSMYVGQSAWGNANLETKWSGEFLVQLTYSS